MSMCRLKTCFIMSIFLIVLIFCSIGCAWKKIDIVNYVPSAEGDLSVALPQEEDIDQSLIDELYSNAAKRETLYGLLVLKNGSLIAEAYFNGSTADHLDRRASVTKSYTAAMLGIALDKGYITNLDQPMLDFFPEHRKTIHDNRKKSITIRHMVQMRAGFPWEETDKRSWEGLWSGEYLSLIEKVPLTAHPGNKFQYSNLTANWLGIIVARACSSSLRDFGQSNLFDPLGAQIGPWQIDTDGYYIGCGDIQVTARDMAKFGQLYLDGGKYKGNQIISEKWVDESLKTYSTKAWTIRIGRNIKNIGYGYMWWSARSGKHTYNFAWGHGGNLIVLLHEYNMVIVVTADPFYGKSEHFKSWKYEKANINLVADFIAKLP